jgi:hypothetical protein
MATRKTLAKMHITGPWYDVMCDICNESIMDGEFTETRAEAREILENHASTHEAFPEHADWPGVA